MRWTNAAAASMALIPACGVPPWAALPVKTNSSHSRPLCPMHSWFRVGSPTIAPSAVNPEATRCSAPRLSISSSMTAASVTRPAVSEPVRFNATIAAAIAATAPFMSVVPRPRTRPFSILPGEPDTRVRCVERHSVGVAAEQEVRPRCSAFDRAHEVGAAVDDLDDLGVAGLPARGTPPGLRRPLPPGSVHRGGWGSAPALVRSSIGAVRSIASKISESLIMLSPFSAPSGSVLVAPRRERSSLSVSWEAL